MARFLGFGAYGASVDYEQLGAELLQAHVDYQRSKNRTMDDPEVDDELMRYVDNQTLPPAESLDYDFVSKLDHVPEWFFERVPSYFRETVHLPSVINEHYKMCEFITRASLRNCDIEFVEGRCSKVDLRTLRSRRYFYDVDRKEFILSSKFDSAINFNVKSSPDMLVLPEIDILFGEKFPMNECIMQLTIAGPGCGKTYDLVSLAKRCRKISTVILTTTRMSCKQIEERLPGYYVRTIDSYLITTAEVECDILLVDEVFLAHPGKILCAINKSKCAFAHGFGDPLQIPFIDRSSFGCQYSDCLTVFPVSHTLSLSYRLCSDVIAVLHSRYAKYGMDLKSTRNARSVAICIHMPSRSEYDVILTYTQSEKKHLIARYPGVPVYTVHEYQGRETEKVLLHVLGGYTPDSLVNSESHAIVALSRHRSKLTVLTDRLDSIFIRMAMSCRVATDEMIADVYHSCGGFGEVVLSNDDILFEVESDPYEYVAVPRISTRGIPPRWTDKQVLCIRLGGYVEAPVSVSGDGTYKYMRISRLHKFNYSKLDELFKLYSRFVNNRFVVYYENTFPSVQGYLVVRLLNRYGARGVTISGPKSNIVSPEAANVATTNVLVGLPEKLDVRQDRVFLPAITYSNLDVPCDDVVGCIESFVQLFYSPEVVFTNDEFDDFMFHANEFSANIESFRFNPNFDELVLPKFSKMVPLLKTPCPRTQRNTPRNAIWSIMKRNANVPMLATVDDDDTVADTMVDRVMSMLKSYKDRNIDLTAEAIQDWLDDQPESVRKQVDTGIPIHDVALDLFKFTLKPNPKPDLTLDCLSKYPAVQTILSQSKDINAIFCPLFRIIRDRIMSRLLDKVMFFTKLDDSDFAAEFTRRFPPSKSSKFKALEFDMSKYDKSQGYIVLEFECRLMRAFGIEDWLISLWRNQHTITRAKSIDLQLSFDMVFQRKSGDAATYLGNTLILLVALTDIIDIDDMAFGLFSGDDSLIFVPHDLNINYDILATRYNFEVKLFEFKYHYFCSKFFVPFQDQWYIVPDPLKRAVKLGRHDLVNEDHVEEYRISFVDNVAVYQNEHILPLIADAMLERYSLSLKRQRCNSVNVVEMGVRALFKICDKKIFHSLFSRPLGGLICEDPSRPKLEI